MKVEINDRKIVLTCESEQERKILAQAEGGEYVVARMYSGAMELRRKA